MPGSADYSARGGPSLPTRAGGARTTYDGAVSQTSPDQPPTPPEPSWQQPPFAPQPDPETAPVLSGAIVVPNSQMPPPSVVESAINVVRGVLWPVMLVLAIFGPMNLFTAIAIAIVGGAVLGQVSRELKRRRRAPYQLPGAPGPDTSSDGELR